MSDIKEQSKIKKYKCSICGEKFLKEEITKKSGKNYCKNCLAQHEEQKKNKPKTDWDILFQYICKIYNIKVPTGFMFMQLKQYRQDFNYTDIGIYYTLKYYYEVLEQSVIDGTGLGIVPYYYEKAKEHYNKVFDLQDIVDNFENNEKEIYIKTKIMNKKIEEKKPLPLNKNWEEIDEKD